MEFLEQLWQTIAPYVAGISISGIISAIIYGCLKGAFNKTLQKINIEKIAEKATEGGIDKVKKISFSQSIQPLVESELKKITEQANEYIKVELTNMQKKYDAVIKILEKLSAYFDNSIGITEEAKENVKLAISEAKNKPIETQIVKVEEYIDKTENVVKTGKTVAKISNIER